MAQYIVRLATADDMPEVLRLQEQFITELADPLGVAEGSHEHSEFVLIEAVDERGQRAVAITSLMRASSAPFVCEQVFPDLWAKVDLCARAEQSNIRRDDLAENDWGYVEKEHRGNRLALLCWAGSMLLAHHRGYPACLGIANQAALARMGSAFHPVGLSSELPVFATSSGCCSPRGSCRAWLRSSTARSRAIPVSYGECQGLIFSASPLLRPVCRSPSAGSPVSRTRRPATA